MIDKVGISKDFIETNVIKSNGLVALTSNFRDGLKEYASITAQLMEANNIPANSEMINSINSAAETFHNFRQELTKQK